MTQPSNQVKVHEQENFNAQEVDRQALRQSLKQQRANVSPLDKNRWDTLIAEHLKSHILQSRPTSVAVFWPIQSEPDLLACFADLHAEGITLALPIVVAKAQPLKFVTWQPGQEMELDRYGIPMPKDRNSEIVPACIVAPCVGFNQENFRLGYGGGFYDRSLAKFPEATSIGVAYEIGRASFPADRFDIALNTIITEAATYYR